MLYISSRNIGTKRGEYTWSVINTSTGNTLLLTLAQNFTSKALEQQTRVKSLSQTRTCTDIFLFVLLFGSRQNAPRATMGKNRARSLLASCMVTSPRRSHFRSQRPARWEITWSVYIYIARRWLEKEKHPRRNSDRAFRWQLACEGKQTSVGGPNQPTPRGEFHWHIERTGGRALLRE